jgi:hypothetical protein
VAAKRTRYAAAISGALSTLLLFISVLLGYATRSLFNERVFADRVAVSLADPRVAEFAAVRIADAVIDASPNLVGVRPVLIGLTRSTVESPPFRAVVRRGARTLHHSIMTGASTELVVSAQDLGSILKSMETVNPALARKIPPRISAALGRLESVPGGSLAAKLVRVAHRLRALTWLVFVLGLALGVIAVWLSAERRRAIVRLGVSLLVLSLVLGIVARFGGDILARFAHPADLAQAVAGLGGAFLTGLAGWACVLGFAGLVFAAASASLLERVPLVNWGSGAWRWLTGPQPHMRARFARGAIGAAGGAALVFAPLPSLTVAGWCAGVVLAFAGLREAFVAALHLLPEIGTRARETRESQRAKPRLGAIALVGALATLLLAGAWWRFSRDEGIAAPIVPLMCNGSSALCDRRLDEVVFPTSHNSMGGADVSNWMFPSQSAGIRQQLEDGVRGFLIDAHYGEPVGDRVKTILDNEQAAMAKYERAIGKEGMAAALRIRDRLGREEAGPRDVYMCHGFCELGAVKMVPILTEMREFLVANPGEVLILVIQDESVTPADIQRCFEESGLIDFVYLGQARPPWPTLREMVDSDQRVLVMAENQVEGVPWYHKAFEVMQETPYEFHDPSEFSNKANRGGTAGSLLLLNHWIETTPMPKPSNAAIVNARDALLSRVRACERMRGHMVNLVAVDFCGVGDLISVARELNERPVGAIAKR